jgi:hypothetical protein
MPDYEVVLTRSNYSIMCPHGGQVTAIPSAMGNLDREELLDTDTFVVAGCPFVVPPGRPSPCVRVLWLGASSTPDPTAKDRRKVVIPPGCFLRPESVGICLGQGGQAQGQAVVVAGQYRQTGLGRLKETTARAADAARRALDDALGDLGGL